MSVAGIGSLAGRGEEKSTMSASLLVPHHSNPRRGRGNVEDGKQANNHESVYLRGDAQTVRQGRDEKTEQQEREGQGQRTEKFKLKVRREHWGERVKGDKIWRLLDEDHVVRQMLA